MSKTRCPLTPGNGTGTFSDNLVGNQITDGSSQMTGENFLFTPDIPEKDDRSFITGDFSEAVSLDDLLPAEGTQVQPQSTPPVRLRRDYSDGSFLALYGSLSERLRVGVERVIRRFPAALVVNRSLASNTAGWTATGLTYSASLDRTTLYVPQMALKNDFSLDFSASSILSNPEEGFSDWRNFTRTYTSYVLDVSGVTYPVLAYTAPKTTEALQLVVGGRPFASGATTNQNFLLRPGPAQVETYFQSLEDTEAVLLNRDAAPLYTASFKVPMEQEGGTFYQYRRVTWPTVDGYNLDIKTSAFTRYVQQLNEVAEVLDGYKSNLISRFLVSGSLLDFDTPELSVDHVFKIYGRSFDEVSGFIDGLAQMRRVSYDRIDNLPDLLLKNLCETLGLDAATQFEEDELTTLLYRSREAGLQGEGLAQSLQQADVELYRRLLVNCAHLFKAKGTRKALEFLMAMVGAPPSLYQFDEHVQRVQRPLDVDYVMEKWGATSGATYSATTINFNDVLGVFEVFPLETVSRGTNYSQLVNKSDLPVDKEGYPTRPVVSEDFYFQKGAGWFERTTEHKGAEVLDPLRSNLTGTPKTIKTKLADFSFGAPYLDRFSHFPRLGFGFEMDRVVDNIKSHANPDSATEKLTLNTKNVDLYLSAGKAVGYDVWRTSQKTGTAYGVLPAQGGTSFAQFLDRALRAALSGVNTLKYQKGYPDLVAIYREYVQAVGVGQAFSLEKVGAYIRQISPLWIRLIEQFIPATTLWSGGHRVENGPFFRNKFRYNQSCKVRTLQDRLYPTGITETLLSDLARTTQEKTRGLCLVQSLTVQPVLTVGGTDYAGSGRTVQFTYAKTDNCGLYPSYSGALPLICNYPSYMGFDEAALLSSWRTEVGQMLDAENTRETFLACGLSGITRAATTVTFQVVEGEVAGSVSSGTTECVQEGILLPKKKFDYFIDGEVGAEVLTLKTYKYGPSQCTGDNLKIGVQIQKEMTCTECSLWAELLPTFTGTSVDCTVTQDLRLHIYNGTPFDGVASPNNYSVTINCAADSAPVYLQGEVGCDTMLVRGVDPSVPFDLLIGDAANCQIRLRFLGMENLCVGGDAYICNPLQQIESVYSQGLHPDSFVMKIQNPALSGETLSASVVSAATWKEGGDYILVHPSGLTAGDRVVGADLDPYSLRYGCRETTATQWQWRTYVVQATSCVYTTKTMNFNNEFFPLPDEELLTYDGSVYRWKKAYEVVATDLLVTSEGTAVPITTTIGFDGCNVHLYTHVAVDSKGAGRVGLFNGVSHLFVAALDALQG